MADAIDVASDEVEVVDDHAGLVPMQQSATVEMAVSPERALQLQRDYHALCEALLVADDYQSIGNRRFRKKSGWRKLAVAFNVSTELLSKEYVRDADGLVVSAEMVVRATAPNGRYMDGIGICSRSERAFSKPEHDIPATAMTRATNRACSDLFGMGEVSAEEMSETDPTPRQTAAQPASRHQAPTVQRAQGKTSTEPPKTIDGVRMASHAQVKYARDLFVKANYAPSDEAKEVERFTNGRVSSIDDMSMSEAKHFIEELKS